MTQENIDTHTTNLSLALKARKKLSKMYAKQVEAMDCAVDKVKVKHSEKISKFITSLPAEVAELVKTASA